MDKNIHEIHKILNPTKILITHIVFYSYSQQLLHAWNYVVNTHFYAEEHILHSYVVVSSHDNIYNSPQHWGSISLEESYHTQYS